MPVGFRTNRGWQLIPLPTPQLPVGFWRPSLCFRVTPLADRSGGPTATTAGNPKIPFPKSMEGSNTWSAPIAISDNPAGSGVFNPAINVSPDGQRVTVSFYDHRDNPGSDVLVNLYLAQSFNGGATWEPNIRV